MKFQRIALLNAALAFAAANATAATYTVLHSFGVQTNISGFEPHTALVQDTGGTMYGATFTGEGNSAGTIFKVQPDGSSFQLLMSFTTPPQATNSNGANPNGNLLVSGNAAYGTTFEGGLLGDGVVFSLTFAALVPIPINIQLSPDGDNAILTWTNAAFSLQAAPGMAGVYTNVPSATSPYTNAISAAEQFFRLEAN